MALVIEYQKISIEDVQGIVVSEIEADEAGQIYSRLIQIYVDPPGTDNRRPVLELLLHGGDQTVGDKTGLEIITPPLPY